MLAVCISLVFVVLAIIATLVYTVRQTLHEHYRRVSCMNNLEVIGKGCHLYAKDHQGKFPDQLKDLDPNYVTSPTTFVCPAAHAPAGTISYSYVKGFSEKDGEIYEAWILAYDNAAENHDQGGRAVLFVDGHVLWMVEDRFKKALQEQNDKLKNAASPASEK